MAVSNNILYVHLKVTPAGMLIIIKSVLFYVKYIPYYTYDDVGGWLARVRTHYIIIL